MFEAKQGQEGGNALRWKHSGGRWVSVEDCADLQHLTTVSQDMRSGMKCSHEIWRQLLHLLHTEDFKENKKYSDNSVEVLNDNSQYVQRGRALACCGKVIRYERGLITERTITNQ